LGNGTAALVALLDAQATADNAEAVPTSGADAQALARALIARAVRFRQNKRCREAIEAASDGDATSSDGARALLTAEHARLKVAAKSDAERETKSRKIDVAIASSLRTSRLLVFIGWLTSDAFGGRRNTEQFRALWSHFVNADESAQLADVGAKLRVLLTGVYTDAEGKQHAVLDEGRAWLPGAKARAALRRAHPALSELLAELEAAVAPQAAAAASAAQAARQQRSIEARGVPKADDFPALGAVPDDEKKKKQKKNKGKK
jgi:hypothetical protein